MGLKVTDGNHLLPVGSFPSRRFSRGHFAAPTKIDDLADDPLTGQFYAPVDTMDQVYLSFEAYF